MQYHVYSNVEHDKKLYKAGDTIDLDKKAAAELLEIGVIGTEAAEVTPEVDDEPVPAADANVGGQPDHTGEPSLDGDAPAETEAADVTPEVSEKMTREELEEAARAAGIDAKAIEDAPNKGALVSLIKGDAPAETPSEDPSANL